MKFIGPLIAGLVAFGIPIAAHAQSDVRQCRDILRVTDNKLSVYSTSEVRSAQIRNFCEIEKTDVNKIRSSGEQLDLFTGYGSAFGSGNRSNTEVQRFHKEFCDIASQSNYRMAEDYRESQSANESAINAWRSCVETVAATKNVFANVTPQDFSGNEFTVRLRVDPPVSRVREVISISPPSIRCETSGSEINGRYKFDTDIIILDCERDTSSNQSLIINTSEGAIPAIKIPGGILTQSVKIEVNDFYGGRERNSWGVLEVELFDLSGNKIKISDVEYSSCWLKCDGNRDGKTIPSSQSISDGATGRSNDEVWRFWAPSELVHSDEGEWISLSFEPSGLSRIVIHHFFSGGCMRACGDKATSKDRATPRALSITLGDGTRFTAIVPNIDRTEISISR